MKHSNISVNEIQNAFKVYEELAEQYENEYNEFNELSESRIDRPTCFDERVF